MRKFQYSLKQLLVAVAILAVMVGGIANIANMDLENRDMFLGSICLFSQLIGLIFVEICRYINRKDDN